MSSKSQMTQLLSQSAAGDSDASAELLQVLYDELRCLAKAKLAKEKLGNTLQPTALVHEAYLRLVAGEGTKHWDNEHHFLAAASEAMRRILVDSARRKKRLKHGGELRRVDIEHVDLVEDSQIEELLAVDETLDLLEADDEQAAALLKLRYFAGLSVEQAAELLGIPERTAYRSWAYARAWVFRNFKRS